MMVASKVLALVAASAALLVHAAAADAPFTPRIVTPTAPPTVVRSYADKANGIDATLVAQAVPGYTDGPMYFFNVTAETHYGAGYAYGRLLANETAANFKSLFAHEAPQWWEQLLLEWFVGWQYTSYVQPNLPQEYAQEMQGVADGAASIGYKDVGKTVQQGIALASIATGSVLDDIIYLLKSELTPEADAVRSALADAGVSLEDAAARVAGHSAMRLGKSCSFWGAWSSRTKGGQLYSGRNLDWAAETGVSKYKVISVYHIGTGIPHASISFAGLIGSITGMSAAGITVHEAGDDNKLETLKGFAWSLRLRGVMENAHNLAEAKAYWQRYNNTLGINHGIGSAADPKFMALETRAGYTAFFEDNDAREAARQVNGTTYGFPMPHAVWRTNHGYDPTFLQTAVASGAPGKDTFTRYMLLHDTLAQYEAAGIEISEVEAVNMTAVPGDKGGDSRNSFVTCGASAVNGENIVSASFAPAQGVMYVAFEDGSGEAHVPACCNNYAKLDMAPWFGGM